MDNWWNWAKWAVYNIVAIALLLTIYSGVIETRFECLMFSMAALIYLEVVAEYWIWGVELLRERDHRNEIYKSLSERLGAPLDAESLEAIGVLSAQTAKAHTHLLINGAVRWVLSVIILWNLLRAFFFWSGS